MCSTSWLQAKGALSTLNKTGRVHMLHTCDRNTRQMRYLVLLSQTTRAHWIAAMHAEGYSIVGASLAPKAVFCCTPPLTAYC